MKTPARIRVLPSAVAFAAAFALSIPAHGSNPAVDRFQKEIVFYASFDQGLEAEISSSEAPAPAGSCAEFVRGGGDPFVPGIFGKALKSSEHELFYDLGKEPWISQSGGIVLWLAVHQRTKDDYPYFWPILVRAGKRLVLAGQMGDPLNKRAVYAYTEGEEQKVSAIQGNMMEWAEGEWHLMVVNWRPNAVEISVDGRPAVRGELKQAVNFEGEQNRLYISSPLPADADTFRIDEVMLFKRPLDTAEIEWIQTHAPLVRKPAAPAKR